MPTAVASRCATDANRPADRAAGLFAGVLRRTAIVVVHAGDDGVSDGS